MFLERRLDPALSPATVIELAGEAEDCFGMHSVEWRGSLLSLDGHKMFCWFSAPDMESARIAMRQIDADTRMFWRGNVYDGKGIGVQDVPAANVLVERSFDDPVTLQDIQLIEDAGISCLETRNVRFIRTFFSADQKRMICLYQAPDAESVRQAQREAGVPFEHAWAFKAIGPDAPEDATTGCF
jgi:hypothetical protein